VTLKMRLVREFADSSISFVQAKNIQNDIQYIYVTLRSFFIVQYKQYITIYTVYIKNIDFFSKNKINKEF